MFFYVYRLRSMGMRQTKADMAREGMAGEVVLLPYEHGWRGRPVNIARLYKPGTQQDLVPQLVGARVVGVRRSMLISGEEEIAVGRKGADRFAQTWLCSPTPIDPRRWANFGKASPRSATGFDAGDDDIALSEDGSAQRET